MGNEMKPSGTSLATEAARYYASASGIAVLPMPGIGHFVGHVPGAQAHRLFLDLVEHSSCGGTTTERQSVPLALLNRKPKSGNLSRARIIPLLDELRRAGVPDPSDAGDRVRVIGVISEYELAETDAGLRVRWHFGATYVATLARDRAFGKVDTSASRLMRGKYAPRLFTILSGHFGKRRSSIDMTVDDFRAKMGAADLCARFNKLRTKVIEPAVEEITRASRYEVFVHYCREGRSVTALTFSWALKLGAPGNPIGAAGVPPTASGAAPRATRSGPGKPTRRTYRQTPIPSSPFAFRNSDWEQAFWDAHGRGDPMPLLADFRKAAEKDGRPLIPYVFYCFVLNVARDRGWVPGKAA